MSGFERGVQIALDIYQAGVMGLPMPLYPQVSKADAQALYSEGMMAALEEIDHNIADPELNPQLARGAR